MNSSLTIPTCKHSSGTFTLATVFPGLRTLFQARSEPARVLPLLQSLQPDINRVELRSGDQHHSGMLSLSCSTLTPCLAQVVKA